MAFVLKVPTKEEISEALQIPKVLPPLDSLGRTNRPTTSKSIALWKKKPAK